MLRKNPNVFFEVGKVNVFSWQVGWGQNFEEGDQIAVGNLSMRHEISLMLVEKLV